MIRPIFSLVLLLAGCVVLAAPAPDPFKSGWGNPVDPDRDCTISRDNGVLTIELPGTVHEYNLHRKRLNAPRLMREFEGDFEMEVRLRIARRPSKESLDAEQHPFVAAGFLVIPPEEFPTKYCRMEYRVAGFGISPNGYVAELVHDNHGEKENIKGDKNWSFKGEPEHVYLRLKRWGERLRYVISPDGKEWVTVSDGQFLGLPAKLKVGLATHSTSTEPSKVVFDQLKLAWVKKEEK